MHRYVPTPLGHSSAAVSLDTLLLDMPAMVRTNTVVCPKGERREM